LDESRIPTPSRSEMPSRVSPHSYRKLVIGSNPGEPNHANNPGNVFAPFRNPAADHAGSTTFVIPAQKYIQPSVIRRRNIPIRCAFVIRGVKKNKEVFAYRVVLLQKEGSVYTKHTSWRCVFCGALFLNECEPISPPQTARNPPSRDLTISNFYLAAFNSRFRNANTK
jgi:hypothetical protein